LGRLVKMLDSMQASFLTASEFLEGIRVAPGLLRPSSHSA